MFTFNGKHCSEFDIMWKTSSRPIMPTLKEVSENFIEQDGSIDYSTYNADKREHYEDRLITGTIIVKNSFNLATLQSNLSRIAEWLMCGWGDLIFDDMPTTIWRARASIDNMFYLLEKYGQANLTFRCEPFSRINQLTLDSNVELGSEIILGVNSINNFTITTVDSEYFEGYIDLQGQIPTWYSKPVITLSGAFRLLTINGLTIDNGYANFGEFVLDFKNRTVKVDGENILEQVSGSFKEIQPNQDKLYFSGVPIQYPVMAIFKYINCVPNSRYVFEAVSY